MSNTRDLAERLRRVLDARVPVFTTEQGRQVWAIYGAAGAMLVLDEAAKVLEALAPPNPADALQQLGADPALVERARAICDEPVRWQDALKETARRSIADYAGNEAVECAIDKLCERLGVEL